MATMRDVAKQAGVSMSAVSRILNQDPSLSVTEETRHRVMDAVRQLGYKLPIKRSAASHIGRSILLIMSLSEQEQHADTYFLHIREGIERQADLLGVRIGGIFRGLDSLTPEESQVLQRENDGILVVGNINPQEIQELFPEVEPVVFVDCKVEMNSYDTVRADFVLAIENSIEYLMDIGCEKIGFMGGPGRQISISGGISQEIEEIRRGAFRKYMKEKGCLDEKNIYQLEAWSPAAGYEAMKEILAEGGELPEAFIIASDRLAMGALRAAHEAGLQLPEKLKILSFNDMPDCEFLQPSLTSVHIPTIEMGREAMNLLWTRLQHSRTYPLCINIPTHLVVRQTTGNIHSNYYERQLL